MKIGIMTWFRYNNYGTVLQAYALQQIINKLGYDSLLIDYQARGANSDCNTFNDVIIKFKNKVFQKYNKNIKEIFDNFINNNINKTNKCSNYIELQSIAKKFDGIVCGSDQIWSPNNYDENMFLTFANNKKIMSYAPSFGVNSIENEHIKKRLEKLLNRFDFVSVREETGKKIIQKITNINCEVVLDPTLLLNKMDWETISKESKLKINNLPKNYLLCYFLGKSDKYLNSIKKFAQNNNLSIINIPVFKKSKLNKYNLKQEIGPCEFIKLFLDAKYIFTDSFHGTIFSINFEKEFYTFKRFKDTDKKSQNSRVIDILNKLDLTNRLVVEKDMLSNKKIDFNKCKVKLDKLINHSKDYLEKSLEKITKNEYIEQKNCATKFCCGCGTCKNICPKNAITMSLNDEGFYEAIIDEKKCINCGLCKKVCPMHDVIAKEIESSTKCYSLKAKDEEVLLNSSSGGAGYVIAEHLNNMGYYVIGCNYNNNTNSASHIVINPNRKEELSKIQGSKYIQSKFDECIEEIINIGKKGEKCVVFGTPCQIAGIDKLLKNKKMRDNFILVDLICHGIPSYKLWNKYLKEIHEKINEKICTVCFRDKEYGWRDRRINIKGKRTSYTSKDTKDNFYAFFRLGIVDNNCCYECPYRMKSASDIKIGDFWGSKFHNDSTGVSIVLVNTRNGEKILEELSKSKTAKIEEQSIENFYRYQYTTNKSPNLNRNTIIKELDGEKELKEIRKKYMKYEEMKDTFYRLVQKVRKNR